MKGYNFTKTFVLTKPAANFPALPVNSTLDVWTLTFQDTVVLGFYLVYFTFNYELWDNTAGIPLNKETGLSICWAYFNPPQGIIGDNMNMTIAPASLIQNQLHLSSDFAYNPTDGIYHPGAVLRLQFLTYLSSQYPRGAGANIIRYDISATVQVGFQTNPEGATTQVLKAVEPAEVTPLGP